MFHNIAALDREYFAGRICIRQQSRQLRRRKRLLTNRGTKRRINLPHVVTATIVAAQIFGCAGYQVGTRSLYRPDVYSVSVPIFDSDSLRRDLGERLTEAVVKEIELKTPYKVVDGVAADSILSGRILRDSKYVVAENVNDEPRDIETELQIEVSWRDRRGDLIAEAYTFGVPSSLVNFGQAVHLVPEGGQSVATAPTTSNRAFGRADCGPNGSSLVTIHH